MIRVLLLLMTLALPLRAEEYPALFAVTGVAGNDVLNIRARPDATAPIIGALDPDAAGIEILGVSGTWAMVNAGEGAGYASLRYLRREPGPGWTALQTPLSCIGTEPFWSLEIDPAAGLARAATPEAPEPVSAPITARWPAVPSSRTVAVGLADGVVVLTPAECSDGMSDRRYAIAVDIFRSTPGGTTRQSGCCRLDAP